LREQPVIAGATSRLISHLLISERARLVGAVTLFVAMFIQFFGTQLRTGFRIVAGDTGDGLFVAFIHEHVYQSLLGRASFLNPTFYYPAQGVIGYSDTFLLNQIFYAPLRALGFENFIAVQLTFMALSMMGGIAFAALLIRFLGVRRWLAIISAAIFAYGHSLYVKTGHPQHMSIHFLPVAAYLGFASVFAARATGTVVGCAFAAGLIFGLTFVSGYYMPWFFSFFVLWALPVFAFLYWTALVEFVQANRRRVIVSALAGAVGFSLGAALLLWIYLPAIAALRGLTVSNFLASAATFRDIINVSDTHLMWGALLHHLGLIPLNRLQNMEVSLAVTPLLVVMTIVGFLLLLRRRQSSHYDRIVFALGAAVLFGYVMVYVFTITFQGTTSLFFLVQKFVPGGLAIRVGFRSQVASALFIVLAFATCAEAYLRRGGNASPPWRTLSEAVPSIAVFTIGAVLALEQIDLKQWALLDRSREIAWLESVPPPPADCRVITVYNDGSRILQAIQIDAMRVGQKYGLPTINGYSGGVPPGWDINVWAPSYLDTARKWMNDKGVAGPLCRYDATKTSWERVN
jgi:hypothetical protein